MAGTQARGSRTQSPAAAALPCALLLSLAGAPLVAPLAAQPGAAPAPAPPGCSTSVSRAGAPAASAGARIAAVRIVTHPPRPFRGPARRLGRFHARTVAPTIRRELLFAAGDTLAPVRVAESLRRLRALGFIEDAWLTVTRCGEGAGRTATLTVETRDAWSTIPEANWSAAQQTLGLHETNLLGTGRTLSVVLRWDANRLGDSYRFGGQLAASDPALTPAVAAGASYVAYVDGRAWALGAATRRRGLADPWTASASVSQSVRDPRSLAAERVRRERGAAIVGRRVSPADAAPTARYLLAGVEVERTRVNAAPGSAVVGPLAARRTFVGADAGVALRAVRFDTLSWLLPLNGIADLPRGVETEVVVAAGRDLAASAPAVRADGWVGRVWRPGARGLVAGDLWAGGYLNGAGARDAGGGPAAVSARALVSAFRPATRGLWTARLTAERRLDPDPDARAWVGLDPTAVFVAPAVRLATATAVASVERTVHLRTITRALVLDGALFGAASRRWGPAASLAGDPVTLGVAGVGVRVAPTRPGPATVGLDLGFPVLRPAGAGRGPVVRVVLVPWLAALRGRGR